MSMYDGYEVDVVATQKASLHPRTAFGQYHLLEPPILNASPSFDGGPPRVLPYSAIPPVTL